MNLPPKVRSDYHHLCQDEDFLQFMNRWLKPSLFLIVGFLGGYLCNRMFVATHHNEIAYKESPIAFSLQMSTFSSSTVPTLKN